MNEKIFKRFFIVVFCALFFTCGIFIILYVRADRNASKLELDYTRITAKFEAKIIEIGSLREERDRLDGRYKQLEFEHKKMAKRLREFERNFEAVERRLGTVAGGIGEVGRGLEKDRFKLSKLGEEIESYLRRRPEQVTRDGNSRRPLGD